MATDVIGARGEAIFTQLMTEFDTEAGPLFNPCFLGEKWPALDFMVTLEGEFPATPFFFVQVKTTRAGYTPRSHRLKAQVTAEQMRRLDAYPAPTYIVGIDEVSKQGYLIASRAEAGYSLSSIPTLYSLNRDTRALLWREVQDYWRRAAAPILNSRFSEPHPEDRP